MMNEISKMANVFASTAAIIVPVTGDVQVTAIRKFLSPLFDTVKNLHVWPLWRV